MICRKIFALLIILFSCLDNAIAQDDLFGSTEKDPKRGGVVFGFNANFDIPMADMAKRYGLSYRIGPSLLYKTKSNWMIGAKFDWIFGGKIKDDSLMWNIKESTGDFITNQGDKQGVGTFERGYCVGLQVGKLVKVSKKNPNQGLLVMTGVGFMQHKINIFDKDRVIAQLSENYKKGYDRLTNGIYVEQYIGFSTFHPKSLLNFHLGFDFLAGFTQGRRDYQFDLMRKDDAKRVDMFIGIRGGWYIPFFRKKSDEFFFD